MIDDNKWKSLYFEQIKANQALNSRCHELEKMNQLLRELLADSEQEVDFLKFQLLEQKTKKFSQEKVTKRTTIKKNRSNLETNKSQIASKTAKSGLKNEEFVMTLLNQKKPIAGLIKDFLGLEIGQVQKVSGLKKTDISDGQNFLAQVKKTQPGQPGHIDRHWLDYFFEKIPELEPVEHFLRGLCEKPVIEGQIDQSTDVKKLDLTNYSQEELDFLIATLNENKEQICHYGLLGYEPEWQPNCLMAVKYNKGGQILDELLVWKMTDVLDELNKESFQIRSSKTVIQLGSAFSLQRKGSSKEGVKGNQLQLKLAPCNLSTNKALVYQFTDEDRVILNMNNLAL